MHGVFCFSMTICLLAIWIRSACGVRCPDWPDSTYVQTWDKGLYNDTCYVVYGQKTSFWSVANEVCELQGWTLFHIKTPDKNTFYTTLLNSLHKNFSLSACFWMGLSDKKKEGEWKWTDGSIANFNLRNGDTDDAWYVDCMMLCKDAVGEGYVWQSSTCEGSQRKAEIICEYDVAPDEITTTATTDTPTAAPVTDAPTAAPVTDEPTAAPVPDVERRSGRKQKHFVFQRMLGLSGHRLLSTPKRVVRVLDITVCARACTSENSVHCAVVNFHRWNRVCALYSSSDAVDGGTEERKGWEVWTVRD